MIVDQGEFQKKNLFYTNYSFHINRNFPFWANALSSNQSGSRKTNKCKYCSTRWLCASFDLYCALMNAKLWRCFWFLSPCSLRFSNSRRSLKRPTCAFPSRSLASAEPSHSPVAFIYAANLNGFWFCTLWSRQPFLALSLARLLPKSFYSATSAWENCCCRWDSRRVLRFENNSIVTFANFCVCVPMNCWRAHASENLLTRALLICYQKLAVCKKFTFKLKIFTLLNNRYNI